MSLVGISSVALARESRISFAAAMALGDQHPQIVAGARAVAYLKQAQQASPVLDANPLVTGAAGPRLTPNAERGFEGSLGVTQSFSVEHAAGLRRDALGAEADWFGAEADIERLARRTATAAAWLMVWEAEKQWALAGTDLANEQELARMVRRLASAHERTAADVATADTRVIEAHLRALNAEGALVEAQSQLASAIGPVARASDELALATGSAWLAAADLPNLSPPSTAEKIRLVQALERLPVVRAKTLLARAELVRGHEESAARGARITVGAEVRHDALGATVASALLVVPIPVFSTGTRELYARKANSARAEGEAASEKTRAQAALGLAFHEIEHTEEVLTLLDSELVPAAETAVVLHQKQIAAGEGTLLELVDARRTLIGVRSRRVQVARERTWALIKVSLLANASRGQE